MKNNIYYQSNTKHFNEIIQLLNTNSIKQLPMLLKYKYKYLGDWLSSFNLFQQNTTWSTKLYCLLNNINNFPKCITCGKILDNVASLKAGFNQYCSKSCLNKSKLRQLHAQQTCLERYGHINFGHGKNIEEKIKQNNIKKYGVPYFNNFEKCKKTIKQRYNVDNISQLDNIKNKKIQTCLKHFNVQHPMQSDIIKSKSKQTCIKKYGVDHCQKSNIIKEKSKQTCLKKYGVEYVSQSHDIRKKMRTTYKYDNTNISTKPELAFYIWLKDNNIKFEYQPKTPILTYITPDKKQHRYFPDFKVNEILYEIKGKHLVDSNGIWTAPKSCNMTNDEYQKHLIALKLKQQCALNNNVIILYDNDYKKYIDYVNNTYGKNYLQQFKVKTNE